MGCGSMERRRGAAFGTKALNPVALAELSPTEFFACHLSITLVGTASCQAFLHTHAGLCLRRNSRLPI
jgi:hypothetical protein